MQKLLERASAFREEKGVLLEAADKLVSEPEEQAGVRSAQRSVAMAKGLDLHKGM